tara:strand:- start:2641 stop:3147 length:507 start_codon:yes stop_codon:yes gene_type:complete
LLLLLPDQLSFRVLQLTLQPEWRKRSTNAKVRCENGDPFDLLVAQIDTMVINWAESAVNWLIDRANDVLDKIPFVGRPLRHWCAPNKHIPQKCLNGGLSDAERQHFIDCEDPEYKGGLDLTCYYHRVRANMHTSPSLLHPLSHMFQPAWQHPWHLYIAYLTHVEHSCA